MPDHNESRTRGLAFVLLNDGCLSHFFFFLCLFYSILVQLLPHFPSLCGSLLVLASGVS